MADSMAAMPSPHALQAPLVLFGAFDRHNFGDMLFAHVAAGMLADRQPVFAGLAERDLEAFGGHRVAPLHRVLAAWDGPAPELIHVGGEILTCTAWQAAVMLQTPQDAAQAIAYLMPRPAEQAAWVASVLGTDAPRMPYVACERVGRVGARLGRVLYNAVGGVGLDLLDEADRAEVVARLRQAQAVGVRDRLTLAHLADAGVPNLILMPDPAAMVKELFGGFIVSRQSVETALNDVACAFPAGYLAVQMSAEFADDATLRALAGQLHGVALRKGLGVVLFRAGAAPWHDDAHALEKVAAWLPAGFARIFPSLNLWDICALIAASRCYVGSSLHGRIVAMAFAVPRLNIVTDAEAAAGRAGKCQAYAQAWEVQGMPGVSDVHGVAAGTEQAMSADPQALLACSARLADAHAQAFRRLCSAL